MPLLRTEGLPRIKSFSSLRELPKVLHVGAWHCNGGDTWQLGGPGRSNSIGSRWWTPTVAAKELRP